jgi:hypothetical protein
LSHLLKWLLLEVYEIVVHHSTNMKRLVCFEYGIALRQGMVLVLLFIAKKGTRFLSFFWFLVVLTFVLNYSCCMLW